MNAASLRLKLQKMRRYAVSLSRLGDEDPEDLVHDAIVKLGSRFPDASLAILRLAIHDVWIARIRFNRSQSALIRAADWTGGVAMPRQNPQQALEVIQTCRRIDQLSPARRKAIIVSALGEPIGRGDRRRWSLSQARSILRRNAE